jgi:hypothetical protein
MNASRNRKCRTLLAWSECSVTQFDPNLSLNILVLSALNVTAQTYAQVLHPRYHLFYFLPLTLSCVALYVHVCGIRRQKTGPDSAPGPHDNIRTNTMCADHNATNIANNVANNERTLNNIAMLIALCRTLPD